MLKNKNLSNSFPDLNRVYLVEKARSTSDPREKEVLEALLQCYDDGRVKMTFDPSKGEMLYQLAEVN